MKELNEKKYCLTCGRCESSNIKLTEETIGVTISKSKLKDRQHYLNEDEKVHLCNDCKEELRI